MYVIRVLYDILNSCHCFHITKFHSILGVVISTEDPVLSAAYFVTWELCHQCNFLMQDYPADKFIDAHTEYGVVVPILSIPYPPG